MLRSPLPKPPSWLWPVLVFAELLVIAGLLIALMVRP